MTGGYGFGYVSDMYQARFDAYQISLFDIVRKTQRKKTLKTCTQHGVAIDARART